MISFSKRLLTKEVEFYFISNWKALRILKQRSDTVRSFRKITLATVWKMALWKETSEKNTVNNLTLSL